MLDLFGLQKIVQLLFYSLLITTENGAAAIALSWRISSDLQKLSPGIRFQVVSPILSGKVFVNGKVVNKCGAPISDKAVVEIKVEVPKYVSRAGYKLEAALEQLEVDIVGNIVLDSGLSTGGFTDCLLQYGASFVYCVDVGYGLVANKIRHDDRVSVVERTNLRYLSELPQKVDPATLDLSFISILTIMPAVVNLMKNDATLFTLIKPHFEARRSQVGGGGIVRDPKVHQEVLAKIINGVQDFGFECRGWIESPLKGADGNKEFLARLGFNSLWSKQFVLATISGPFEKI